MESEKRLRLSLSWRWFSFLVFGLVLFFGVSEHSYSQDFSGEAQALQQLPEPPQLPTTQTDSSQPISERQRLELIKWITFWEKTEMPWREKVKTWWTNLKSSFDKQNVDTENALKAKDAIITAKDLELVHKSQKEFVHIVGWTSVGILVGAAIVAVFKK